MSQPVRTIQSDVVIAGSGPGGATMARELSKKGKKVVLCEAGKNHQWLWQEFRVTSRHDG